MLHMDTGYGESSRRAHDGAILGLGHQLCDQQTKEGIDTGYSMLKQEGATPSARFGACHSKNIRYHLNVVFQFTLEYYFFEVIRNELYFWIFD